MEQITGMIAQCRLAARDGKLGSVLGEARQVRQKWRKEAEKKGKGEGEGKKRRTENKKQVNRRRK